MYKAKCSEFGVRADLWWTSSLWTLSLSKQRFIAPGTSVFYTLHKTTMHTDVKRALHRHDYSFIVSIRKGRWVMITRILRHPGATTWRSPTTETKFGKIAHGTLTGLSVIPSDARKLKEKCMMGCLQRKAECTVWNEIKPWVWLARLRAHDIEVIVNADKWLKVQIRATVRPCLLTSISLISPAYHLVCPSQQHKTDLWKGQHATAETEKSLIRGEMVSFPNWF